MIITPDLALSAHYVQREVTLSFTRNYQLMTLNNLVSCTHTELRYNNGHFFLLLGKKNLVGTKMPNNAKTNKQKTTTTHKPRCWAATAAAALLTPSLHAFDALQVKSVPLYCFILVYPRADPNTDQSFLELTLSSALCHFLRFSFPSIFCPTPFVSTSTISNSFIKDNTCLMFILYSPVEMLLYC